MNARPDQLDTRLLKLPEAAKQLGVSVSTVKVLIARGELVPIRPTGGHPRLTSLELERYVRQSQQEAWDQEHRNITRLRERLSDAGGARRTKKVRSR